MDVLERRAIEADAAAAAAARVQQPVKSSEIKAKQTVRDLGVFTAFEDGRIRVRFADRTIVAIDRWHRFAEVVHRDSTTGTVSVRFLQCMLGLLTFTSHEQCCWLFSVAAPGSLTQSMNELFYLRADRFPSLLFTTAM